MKRLSASEKFSSGRPLTVMPLLAGGCHAGGEAVERGIIGNRIDVVEEERHVKRVRVCGEQDRDERDTAERAGGTGIGKAAKEEAGFFSVGMRVAAAGKAQRAAAVGVEAVCDGPASGDAVVLPHECGHRIDDGAGGRRTPKKEKEVEGRDGRNGELGKAGSGGVNEGRCQERKAPDLEAMERGEDREGGERREVRRGKAGSFCTMRGPVVKSAEAERDLARRVFSCGE